MIKTLIATAMLSMSTSVGAIQPKKANNLNTVQGGYCMRADYTRMDDFEGQRDTVYYVYNYEDYNNENGDIYYFYYDSYNDYSDYIAVRQLYFIPTLNNGFIRVRLHINLGEYTVDYNIRNDAFIDDLPDDMSNGILYFTKPYTLDYDTWYLFNTFYSTAPNDYVNYYNGYYTLLSSGINVDTKWQVFGYCSVNNNLCYRVDFYQGECYGTGIDYSSQSGVFSTDVVERGAIVGDTRILLNGVLINKYHTLPEMQRTGVFQFVQDSTTYEFKDIMISIADVPIRILTGLLSFQLFGIELYVAFMGVLTLVLIGIIIRKLV